MFPPSGPEPLLNPGADQEKTKPRLGISRCLLGEPVRYDGGHKRDRFLLDTLGPFVEWVAVCPEVEAGMATPREAMRLVGDPDSPRLMTIKTQRDLTAPMTRFTTRRISELEALHLHGYVFKKDSPSCGIRQVRVYETGTSPSRRGVGLFARQFLASFPLIPVEDEGRLNDPAIREHFITRVFAYYRWQRLASSRVTRRLIIEFHTRHKYLLLAHSRPYYQELGRLVAKAHHYLPNHLAHRYGVLFMAALKSKPTIRKHVNVLYHLAGHFKKHLTRSERQELQDTIVDFHLGRSPLAVPLTLIRHFARRFEDPYLAGQVYFEPHTKELVLRNYARGKW